MRKHGGPEVPASSVVLTSSTSEAYSLIFKLLGDPGDEILVPRPSYPLFEHLTRLDAVAATPYRLAYDGGWRIDLDSLTEALTPRSRAILVVNPNNPTGSYAHPDDLVALGRIAAERDLAIVSDEVFLDYHLDPASPGRRVGPVSEILVFTLGGLSKLVGLPQVKLAWLTVEGPPALVPHALARLEVICDTYLSVATPIQLAVDSLLDRGAEIRAQILTRVRTNLERLREMVASHPSCSVLRVEGGWYAVVQIPAIVPEEDLVLTLLERDALVIHPGYFFDFPREAFLVFSLLPEPQTLETGAERVVRRLHAMTSSAVNVLKR
jgi:aspartate/methionine/tyrosine aminotransferase